MNKLELIAALKAASGPDRVLDSDVHEAWTGKGFSSDDDWEMLWPYYTADLNVLVAMVPEGWRWSILTDYGGLIRARLFIIPPGIDSREQKVQADAATPALALLIAILRATDA